MANKVGIGGDKAKSPSKKTTPELTKSAQELSKEFNFDFTSAQLARYAALNKITLRDLNGTGNSPTFFKYTKDQIAEYLKDPARNEKAIRDAVIYMYGASAHFWRLIQYFSSLSDLSFYIAPYKIDVSKERPERLLKNYNKTIDFVANMDIKTQCRPMLNVMMREDVGYYTTWITNENITFQQLPPDYCQIASIEDNVPNVSFNFSYFTGNMEKQLEYYPPEFKKKYNAYQKDRNVKWQDLDSPNSFAIKCNNDILNYALPPLAGVLLAIYDLADYQALKLTKTELENYALLVMKLGLNDQGEWEMDFDKAQNFWKNLDGVLPEQVGSVLSPMEIDSIDFKHSGNTQDADTVAQSEQQIYSSSGVSAQLFSNERASGSSLQQSIRSDQSITFRGVKSLEAALNRLIQSQSFGKFFKLTFLDVSPYNRTELSNAYLKAASFGVPVSLYSASIGLDPEDLTNMTFLENDVLDLKSKLIPLMSSNTMSSGSSGNSGSKGPGNVSGQQAAVEVGSPDEDNPGEVKKRGRATNESKGQASDGDYSPENAQ